MDYLPKRRYEAVGQALRHVPEEVLEIRVKCLNADCGSSFRPSWLEKLQPYVPIKPNSGQGRWIPLAATLKCPTCGTDVNLPFPVDKQRASYDWFGDEAYRENDDRFVLTYSLVGTNRVRLPIVEDEVRRFKAQLCPSISPDSWHLHMLEIWSGQKRKEHTVFRTWDAAYVVRFADDFF